MIEHEDRQAPLRFRLLDQAPAAEQWLEESDETFDYVVTAPAPNATLPTGESFGEPKEAPMNGSDEPTAISHRVPETEIVRLREAAVSRIAVAERIELEALARRREAEDRQSEVWAAEQQDRFTQRLDSLLEAEAAEIAERRRTEGERIRAWGRKEHERIEMELAAEEQRFQDRLLRQLEEFEWQLGERLREQEERLSRWSSEAERVVAARAESRRAQERRDSA